MKSNSDDIAIDQKSSRAFEYSWASVARDLDAYGAAVLPEFLSANECKAVSELFSDPTLSRIPPVIDQPTLGNGDYRYFRYPMPPLVSDLRSALYAHLVPIANRWNEAMELNERYPGAHSQFLQICRRAHQTLPASMLLDHRTDQYSLLHQDIYGELSFPLQVAVLLSRPGADFTGGEFVITEQRPRMQTRPEVVTLNQGDAVVLAVSNRPVAGARGTYRVNLRHGFSKVRSGQQRALSITFHDAAA